MKIIGKALFTTNGWDIIKNSYDVQQSITEGSNFMVGNGYLGYRGTFAEDRSEHYQGCIVTDTWDKADGKWEELTTVPNALFVQVKIQNQWLKQNDTVKSFQRVLNVINGMTKREVVYLLKDGLEIKITEEKFASYTHKHVIAMRYQVKTNKACDLKLISGIDSKVWSINGEHLKNHNYFNMNGDCGVHAEATQADHHIWVVEKNMFSVDTEKQSYDQDGIFGHLHEIKLSADESFVLNKFMLVMTSNDNNTPSSEIKKIYNTLPTYDKLLETHEKAWLKIWQTYDIKINGNIVDQVALRFNIYHAIIATPTHKSLPIGARGLSCQAYQGAAFWDQEIYNLPMYLYSNPSIAKNILLYRYKTLSGAKRKAKKHGYEGAFYSWISGKTGDELCPDFFFKDVITNRPIRNHFNVWQIHISPDIAYAVDQYYQLTKDTEFIESYGAEMVFEIARFIVSRVDFKPRRNRYEIVRVQGPDEYHENIDNNSYTNYMTKHAISIAIKYLDILDPLTIKTIKQKIDLAADEITLWLDVNEKLYLPQPNNHNVLEQFDDYFKLESIVPASKVTERLIDAEEYYGWPNGITVYTQCNKQADVVQLLSLFPKLFNDQTVMSNYRYYEPRTLHFSSLSPTTHAIVAARLGLIDEAYNKFRKAVMIDLLNTNEAVSGGTFIGGMHTANNGASWQMVVQGFMGLMHHEGKFHLNPQLPISWDSVSFELILYGHRYSFKTTKTQLYITKLSENDTDIEFVVQGETYCFQQEVTIHLR